MQTSNTNVSEGQWLSYNSNNNTGIIDLNFIQALGRASFFQYVTDVVNGIHFLVLVYIIVILIVFKDYLKEKRIT